MGDMTPRPASTGAAIAPGIVISAGFILTLLVDWPGHLSYDSVLQLLQGRTSVYNTWHPPVMAWMLGLGDAIMPGAALFVTFQAALCFGALLSLLAFNRSRSGWPAALVALACIAAPQFLLYQGIVWKDVLFADAAVASFVCLAHVARVWPSPILRTAVLSASVLLLALAALTRQNGLIVLPLGAMASGLIAWRQTKSATVGISFGLAMLTSATVLAGGATLALNTRSDGDPGPREQFDLLEVYDLSAAIAADPRLGLTILSRTDPKLSRLISVEGARLYTPVRSDPIAASQPLMTALRKSNAAALDEEWYALIFRHPLIYLTNRTHIFWWVLATQDIFQCRPLFAGVEGPPAALKTLGMSRRWSAKDDALRAYGMSLLNTPVFSHLAFGALALAALFLLLRRRRPPDIAIALLLVATLVFTASFFVISIACDYRYLYFLDLSALFALFYLSLDVRSALRGIP